MATPTPPVPAAQTVIAPKIRPTIGATKKWGKSEKKQNGWDQAMATISSRTDDVNRWAQSDQVKFDEASGKYTGVDRAKMGILGIDDQDIYNARRHLYKQEIVEANPDLNTYGIADIGNKTQPELARQLASAKKLDTSQTAYNERYGSGSAAGLSQTKLDEGIKEYDAKKVTEAEVTKTGLLDTAKYGTVGPDGKVTGGTTQGRWERENQESSQALTAQQISTSKTNQAVAIAQNERANDQQKLNWQTLRDTRQTEIERRAHERELQIANNDNLIAHTELMNKRYKDKWESDERIADEQWQENKIQAIVGGLFAVGGAFAV